LVLLWIALREHESEPPSQSFDRVDDRSGLVFVVAAERYAIEERFGLGAFLSITGRSVHGAGLVVPDDLAETRAEVLRAWCASHFVDTPAGPRPWECLTLSEFGGIDGLMGVSLTGLPGFVR